MYEFILTDKNGNKIENLDKAKNRNVNWYLNAAGSASFSLDLRDPKAADISAMETDLKIYRDRTLIWAGRIIHLQESLVADRKDFSVNALGYFALLGRRNVRSTLNFSKTTHDQGDIAWALINHTQGYGTLGITQGDTTTGKKRDRTYLGYEKKNIKDAIEELADCEDGFDFEITPAKVFNCYYPIKSNTLGYYVFEWGKNITEITRAIDGLKITNTAIGIGAGMNENILERISADAGSIQQYGLLESVFSFKDVSVASTLEDKMRRYIREHQNNGAIAIYTMKVLAEDPPLFSYEIGDKIRVKASEGRVDIDAYLRIFGIELSIDENGKEDVTLIVGKEMEI